eukprot:2990636-Pyramimonas_sp.AAC.1
MPVDPLTKDDITKSSAALFDLMSHGRLCLIDEEEEVIRRRDQPELKDRSQAASRRALNQLSWKEFLVQTALPEELGGGGGG